MLAINLMDDFINPYSPVVWAAESERKSWSLLYGSQSLMSESHFTLIKMRCYCQRYALSDSKFPIFMRMGPKFKWTKYSGAHCCSLAGKSEIIHWWTGRTWGVIIWSVCWKSRSLHPERFTFTACHFFEISAVEPRTLNSTVQPQFYPTQKKSN